MISKKKKTSLAIIPIINTKKTIHNNGPSVKDEKSIVRYDPVLPLPAGRPPGEYQIGLRLTGKDDQQPLFAGDEVELIVADDGQGMPEDFDLDQSKSLGLMLTKGLVESQLHGIWDMTSSKTGTRHTIRFKKAA